MNKRNISGLILLVTILLSTSMACICAPFIPRRSTPEVERFQETDKSTQRTTASEATISPSSTHTSTHEPTSTATETKTPLPTNTTIPTNTIEPSPTIQPLVDVIQILGKNRNEVESILGPTILITPITDAGDPLYGGEYRDYEIGDYVVFISYDKKGIARIFQIWEGLTEKNYSITDWKILLPEFGVYLNIPPSRTAPAALHWDNVNGYYIGVVASNTSGKPVWTVQISEEAYKP